MNIPVQPMDWSATIAAIALVVSILGSIIGPIATTVLTNRHQLKLRNMDIAERKEMLKSETIRNCLAAIGELASRDNRETISAFGKTYYGVYAYIERKDWPLLDSFYSYIAKRDFEKMSEMLPDITHLLASLLK